MPTTNETRDQLLADVELTSSRLRDLEARLDDLGPNDRGALAERHDRVLGRCNDLKRQILDWPEVKIGTMRAIEDLGAAVDAFEADLESLRQTDPVSYRTAVDRQLRAWRSRSDWLRLQGALASMEVRDDLKEVGNRLTKARAGALLELREASEDAKELVIDVRDDVEAVLIDIRHAVERAADALIKGAV